MTTLTTCITSYKAILPWNDQLCTRSGSDSTAGLPDHGLQLQKWLGQPIVLLPSNQVEGKKMVPLIISTSLLTYVLPGACSTTFSRLPPKQPLSANNTTSSGENGSAPELK